MRWTCIAVMLWLSAGPASAQDGKQFGVSPHEAAQGFVSLFDGKTHRGWIGDLKGYPIEEGAMTCHGGKIFTENEYENFVLRFEFKLPPGGNNGVGIRTPIKGDAAYVGMEIQVLDDGHKKYKGWLQPWQTQGSIYGVIAARRGFLKPVGQWNRRKFWPTAATSR